MADDKGMVWPADIAPFHIHLLSLKQNEAAGKIYSALAGAGIEVLYDDREEAAAGQKFADADLIGCPYRIVVSEKTLAQDSVELKSRTGKDAEMAKIGSLVAELKARLNQE
jgi:prolyl-tRNA synthetase